MAILNGIKPVTQRFSVIICVALSLLLIFSSAKLLDLIGTWRLIDSLYPGLWYWVMFSVSRAVFSAICVFMVFFLSNVLAKLGFFVFEPPVEDLQPPPQTSFTIVINLPVALLLAVTMGGMVVGVVRGSFLIPLLASGA